MIFTSIIKEKQKLWLPCVGEMSEKEIGNLLKLEFFKGQGFPTKESGMKFIMNQEKLNKKIVKRVNDMEEYKYNVIEKIKEICGKYGEEKEKYMKSVRSDRLLKLENKKEKTKSIFKEEIREELRNEEKIKRINELKKKYPDMIPDISNETQHILETLEQLFINAIENGGDLKKIALMKTETDKALEILAKVKKTIIKMQIIEYANSDMVHK